LFLYILPLFGVHAQVVMHVATGTSLALAVPTSLATAVGHRRAGLLDTRFLRSWVPAIVLGVGVGTLALRVVPGHALVGLFALVLAGVGVQMILLRDDFHIAETVPAGAGRLAIGVAIGALSTMLGLSGGAFITPTLAACRYPIHRAIAISSASGVAIAVLGAIGAIANGMHVP
jgi:uncharacterized membrane protein YfcA